MTTALAKRTELFMPPTEAVSLLAGADDKATEVERFFLAEGADDTDAFNFKPTIIKVASSGAKAFVTADEEIIKPPLAGYVIDSVITRTLYPFPVGHPEGTKVPLCSSVGGNYGTFNTNYTESEFAEALEAHAPHRALQMLAGGASIGDLPEKFACAACPMSQFGSAFQDKANGKGQACKMKVRLLIVPDGWRQPAILVLPTMSVGPWDMFCSTLQSQRRRKFYSFRISFDVQPQSAGGNTFGVVKPTAVGEVEDMQTAQAILTLQRAFRQYIRTVSHEDVEGAEFGSDDEYVDAEVAE